MKTILSATIGALLAMSALNVQAQSEAAERKIELTIEQQSLADALNDWAKQTGLQLVSPSSEMMNSQLAPAIKGMYSPRAALEALLKGTELTYQWVSERAVAIRHKSPVLPIALPMGTAVPDGAGAQDAGPARDEPSRDEPKGGQTIESLATVVVTGTHIRGEPSAGSKVYVVDRTDLDASGRSTVRDFLETLPQNAGGGPSEDFNTGNEGNFNRGTGISLRGLGADATLVLVNGRRQSVGGTEGAFVDVSSIPASAVERIEILTDGASAIYGSDAVGGVVNIVLRQDFEGSETSAHYGTADGDSDELQVSQLFGTTWSTGNFVAGYEFHEREALAFADRSRTASEDQRRFGGDDWRIFLSNPGNILDPATFAPAYAIPRGQDGTSLDPSDLVAGSTNLQDLNEGADLLPRERMHSAFFSGNYRVGERWSLSADGRYSRRDVDMNQAPWFDFVFVPSSNPFFVDPFGGSDFVVVSYNFGDDLGPLRTSGRTETFSGGLTATLDFATAWQAKFSAGYGREKFSWTAQNLVDFEALAAAAADPDPATAFNPFGDGSHTPRATLDSLRTTQSEAAVSDVWSTNITADGPLFDVGASTAKLAAGLDLREESLEQGATDPTHLRRQVFAAFAELALPLIPGDGTRSDPDVLALSLAARYEHYDDFGSTTNPRIGVSWNPLSNVRMRGTWGTSFKAPRLPDLDDTSSSNVVLLDPSFSDPQSPTGTSFVLARFGRNPDLKEETATTWTAGLDFFLGRETDPLLSLTYFDIDYQDRIAPGGPPGSPTSVLLQEDQWAELIHRNPSAAEVAQLCNSPQFFGDPNDCTVTPPVAIVDLRLRNLGVVHVRGIDVEVRRSLVTDLGTFGLGLTATHMFDYERSASDSSPTFQLIDTVGNPLATRLRGSLSWQRGAWSANTSVNYANSYEDDVSIPARGIASWTTVDLQFGYRTQPRTGWSSGLSFLLSAINLFDEEPPFYNSREGYDNVNAYLRGRVVSAQVTKSWR